MAYPLAPWLERPPNLPYACKDTKGLHLPYVNNRWLISALPVADIDWSIGEEATHSQVGIVPLGSGLNNPAQGRQQLSGVRDMCY